MTKLTIVDGLSEWLSYLWHQGGLEVVNFFYEGSCNAFLAFLSQCNAL